MTAYYNEHDIYAAQWLRNLIEAGQIAPGIVDERSIEDVHPSDLRGFTQCHFFAGIGVWSHSLRAAGVPDDYPIWTGSCPCQPFSSAGTGAGENDKRHLWPVFAKLIDACRPPAILGEQVASNLITGKRVSEHLQRLWERKARLGVLADWLEEVRLERGMRELGGEQGDRDGQCHHETPERAIQRASKATDRELEKEDGGAWIDTLQLDLEGMDYSFCCIPFPAAGVGAPHIRDRLYWVADSCGNGSQRGLSGRPNSQWQTFNRPLGRDCAACEFCGYEFDIDRLGRYGCPNCEGDGLDGMADSELQQRPHREPGFSAEHDAGGRIESAATLAGLRGDLRTGPVNGFWADADWLLCRDGKWRPVEPGTFPLVAGPAGGMGRSRADWHTPAGKEGFGHRAGRLKGYGNAINAEAARVFIECVMEVRA